MTQILGTILLAVSLYGYMQFFSKKIKPEFALGFIFASIGSIMFFAGILNILPLAAYTITAVGCAFAALSVKDFKNSVLRIITPGTVFFAVVSVFLVFASFGSYFEGGDAYTHWGTVTKVLIDYDRLPTSANYNITFPSYPTGTASFIYFFCKMLHADSEWFIILVQSVLTLALFIPLFAFAKSKTSQFITAVVVTTLLCTNEPLRFIVVDNLLAAITVCAIAICIYYHDQLAEKFIYILPFSIFLISVKNSGVLFAIVIAVYYFLYSAKNKENLVKTAIFAVAPLVTLKLWQAHVNLLFPTGLLDSHHAMSKARYSNLFEEKIQLGLMRPIVERFFHNVFSFKNPFIYILLAVIIIIVYSHISEKKFNKSFFRLSLFCFAVYLVYQIGLLGTYICSMPAAEIQVSLNPVYGAYHLPSFERYHLTAIAFICCILYIGMLCYVNFSKDSTKSKLKNYAAIIIFTAAIILSCQPNLSYLKKQDPAAVADFTEYCAFIDELGIPKRKSYLMLGRQDSYMLFFTKYYLDPTDCRTWFVETLKENEYYIDVAEYLVLCDTSPETIEYVSQLLGAEITERVIYLPAYR